MIDGWNTRFGITRSWLWGVLVTCLVVLPGAVSAGNYTQCTTNYYTVTGSTIREIRRSMSRNRPARVDRDALTEWTIRSHFGSVRFQGEYRCGGFTTTTTIRITLPRWKPPENVSQSVTDQWTRYITALTQHEHGHAQFALTAAGEMHRRVAEVGTAPDPAQLKSRVDSVLVQTTDEFRNRERAYDQLTNHGLKQGAALASKGDHSRGNMNRRSERSRRDARRWNRHAAR